MPNTRPGIRSRISSPPRRHYLVRSSKNPSLIFCTDGEFRHQEVVGPGRRHGARLYRRRHAAESVRGGQWITVDEVDERGVPWARRDEGRMPSGAAGWPAAAVRR